MKYLYIGLIILLASCSAARKSSQVKPTPVDTAPSVNTNPVVTQTPATAAEVISKLNKIDYKTFSGKIAVDYSDGKNNNSFNVRLNMQKDELVWLSATGPFGIEGARALITKDSVKILNKLKKEYVATSTAYLQEKLGLPVDFTTLQDLLIGNPVFVNAENATVNQQGNTIVITSQTSNFKNLLSVLLPGYTLDQSSLNDVDPANNRSAQLTYSNYKTVDNKNFSTKRNITVTHKNKLEIKMDYESFSFDGTINTPFSVPSGYTIKN